MQLDYRFTMLLFTFLILGVSQTYAQSWRLTLTLLRDSLRTNLETMLIMSGLAVVEGSAII